MNYKKRTNSILCWTPTSHDKTWVDLGLFHLQFIPIRPNSGLSVLSDLLTPFQRLTSHGKFKMRRISHLNSLNRIGRFIQIPSLFDPPPKIGISFSMSLWKKRWILCFTVHFIARLISSHFSFDISSHCACFIPSFKIVSQQQRCLLFHRYCLLFHRHCLLRNEIDRSIVDNNPYPTIFQPPLHLQ